MTDGGMHDNTRILIIDDNQAIHDDFRKILIGSQNATGGLDDAEAALFGSEAAAKNAPGFELDSAFQGQEGLEMVRKAKNADRPYALAFVDVRMPPGWDGIETVDHLWKEDPRLQVVICTAYSDYSWDQMIDVLGASDRLLILKKPFDNVEVRQFACALTKKWNLAQQTARKLDDLEEAVHERTRVLQERNQGLENAVEQLNQAPVQLLQAQKPESIGRSAADIVDEINTPTQFVGDNLRFLKNSFDDLSAILRKCDQWFDAGRRDTLTPELVLEFDAALKQVDVEYLLDEIPKSIGQSLEEIQRIADLVRSMKDFSHPSGDEMQAVDLNKAVDIDATVAAIHRPLTRT